MQLNDYVRKVLNWAKKKGFHDKPIEIGTLLMLIVSELSEALEADRENRLAMDPVEFVRKLASGEPFDGCFKKYIKDTFEDELADVVIRIFDLCGRFGIDLQFHVENKMLYNNSRPYKHGKKY